MAASITSSFASSTRSTDGVPLRRVEGLMLVLNTPKGRGVFASKDIPGRTVLEVCPVLVLDPVENEEHIRNTELYHYTYNWPYTSSNQGNIPRKQVNGSSKTPTMTQAVILGLGTLRDIKAGEELCISYGQRLTFRDTEEELHSQSPDDWTEVMNYIDFIG